MGIIEGIVFIGPGLISMIVGLALITLTIIISIRSFKVVKHNKSCRHHNLRCLGIATICLDCEKLFKTREIFIFQKVCK